MPQQLDTPFEDNPGGRDVSVVIHIFSATANAVPTSLLLALDEAAHQV
jgi:hypothetical protein